MFRFNKQTAKTKVVAKNHKESESDQESKSGDKWRRKNQVVAEESESGQDD